MTDPRMTVAEFTEAIMRAAPAMAASYPMVAAEIARRRKRNPLRWLLMDLRDWLRNRWRGV